MGTAGGVGCRVTREMGALWGRMEGQSIEGRGQGLPQRPPGGGGKGSKLLFGKKELAGTLSSSYVKAYIQSQSSHIVSSVGGVETLGLEKKAAAGSQLL